MSKNPNDSEPAFPSDRYFFHSGMTLRDWFAGQALAGLLANPNDGAIVKMAYVFADAMLVERQPKISVDKRKRAV